MDWSSEGGREGMVVLLDELAVLIAAAGGEMGDEIGDAVAVAEAEA